MSDTQAALIAENASRQLGDLFDNVIGSKDAPSGDIVAAYRQARRAMDGVDLSKPGALALVLAILSDLRTTVKRTASSALQEAALIGVNQAVEEIKLYELAQPPTPVATTVEQLAWESSYDAQAALILALAQSGDMAGILGDGSTVGIMTPAPIMRSGARLLEQAMILAHRTAIIAAITAAGVEMLYRRQAVAVLDARTTDCCRQVNGQTVGMFEPFTLTGAPRYADQMMNPGFHDYCRTAVAIVRV